MDRTGVQILAVLLTIIGACAAYWMWQLRRVKSANAWPRTEATIEAAAPEVVGSNFQGITVKLFAFAFSYKVDGEYYSGRFALMPYIDDPGKSLCERMLGRKLEVGYDPKRPEVCFVPDELIEGCKVQQKIGPHVFGLYPKD